MGKQKCAFSICNEVGDDFYLLLLSFGELWHSHLFLSVVELSRELMLHALRVGD